MAKKAGYQDLEELIKNQTPLKAGNKVSAQWMEKTIALFQIGEDAIEDGLNILDTSTHQDWILNRIHYTKTQRWHYSTPTITVELRNINGSHFQWHYGVVVKKDGTKVNICIGEKDEDPVMGITRPFNSFIRKTDAEERKCDREGEDLNVLIGSKPLKGEEKEAVKKQLLQLFDEEYGIKEEDAYPQRSKSYQLEKQETSIKPQYDHVLWTR